MATLHNRYVLETRTMTASTLSTYSLQAGDTEDASDHAPLIADFSVGGSVAVTEVSPPSMYLAARPNPFTASTAVTFELPEEARVSVDVFDVAGRHIRRLGGGTLTSGPHTFTWDGADEAGTITPAGVFIARITGADISAPARSIRIVRTR